MYKFIKSIVKKIIYSDLLISFLILPAALVLNRYIAIGKNRLPKATFLLKKFRLYKIFNFLEKEQFKFNLNNNMTMSKKTNCLVFLLIGEPIKPLFENCLISLKKKNISLDMIAYCPVKQNDKFKNICKKYNVKLLNLKTFNKSHDDKYYQIGSKKLNEISVQKWEIILDALELGYDNVIYSDVDIVFLENFIPYINEVSNHYKCGSQVEALPWFPINYCCGFMFFNKSSIKLLKKIKTIACKYLSQYHDQDALNYISRNSKSLSNEFFKFPDSLFQSGLLYKMHSKNFFNPMVDSLKPFLFHANFVIGVDNKINLLKRISLWFVKKDKK